MNMVSRERVALADLGASAVAGLGFGLRKHHSKPPDQACDIWIAT
jgi:hypothetical protein